MAVTTMSAPARELDRDDRCPYVPLDFEECSAYAEIPFEPTTSLNERLRVSRTCAHLSVGARNPGQYYARSLGDSAARSEHARAQARRPIGGAAGISYKLEPAYVSRLLARSAEIQVRARRALQHSQELVSARRRPAA